MTPRVSFLVAVAPLLLGACGESTKPSPGSAGASPLGVIAGASGAGAPGSGGAGAAGAPLSFGGAGAFGSAAGSGGSLGRAGGSGGAGANANGGAGAGGDSGGSTSPASAGAAGGVPSGWITVDSIDYSIVPGPNFETVRLMFLGSPCSGSNCHFGGRNHLQVGKTADQLYTYMMSFTTLECGKLINTANPAESALVKYLRGPCGSIERMPSNKCINEGDEFCIPEPYIQAIQQWIENGAPR